MNEISSFPPLVREMTEDDWTAVESIYAEGIATGNATFETAPPSREEWNQRFLTGCRLVASLDSTVVGWAALSPYSRREVYRGVAEVSVYVRSSARGRGVGEALLRSLIARSELEGFWTLQAGIFPENDASLSLHGKVGFRVVGTRKRIGRSDGRWRDVILLERRSGRVGNG